MPLHFILWSHIAILKECILKPICFHLRKYLLIIISPDLKPVSISARPQFHYKKKQNQSPDVLPLWGVSVCPLSCSLHTDFHNALGEDHEHKHISLQVTISILYVEHQGTKSFSDFTCPKSPSKRVAKWNRTLTISLQKLCHHGYFWTYKVKMECEIQKSAKKSRDKLKCNILKYSDNPKEG